jgi:GAF domain-containing protein
VSTALRIFASTAALTPDERLVVLGQQVRRLAAADTLVVQTTDSANTLRVVHADGVYHDVLQGRSSVVGQGVTGWVAANGQFALNSPARVEFDAATAPALRACTAVPLFRNGSVCGVLSVYSIEQNHFTHDNLNFLNAVAGLVSSTLQHDRSPEEFATQALTELGMSELLQANLAADSAYLRQLYLVSGDRAKVDRIQSLFLECDSDAIVVRLTDGDLLCICAAADESLRTRIPQYYGCKIANTLFPTDGSLALELIAKLRQRLRGDSTHVAVSNVADAQLH